MVTRATLLQANDNGNYNKHETKMMLQLRMERNIKLKIRRQVKRTVVAFTSLRPRTTVFIIFSGRWRSVAKACAAGCGSRFEFVAAYGDNTCIVRPTSQHTHTTAGLCVTG